MSNTKITIATHSGETIEAMAPVIISASRSTDIPAFFAKWFINRLEAGYCVWYNPFNQKPSYISFAQCKVVVFWTKNPKPLIPLLYELDERGIRYYFQFTLNDYEKEGFEPNVPSVAQRIETFKELSKLIGKERVIWRFDPFTLIELLVTTAQQNCFSKIKKYTSLRPAGRTSRFFCGCKRSSSHLHIFTRSAFTLIELLVVIAIIAILAGIH